MAAAEPAAEQGPMGKEYPNAMRMGRFVENEISDAEIADMIRAAPAYKVLFEAGILCLDYRKQDQNEIYETTRDFMANSSQANNLVLRGKFACFYGSVGLVMNERNEYIFAAPGMHSIQGIFTRSVGTPKDLGQRCKVIEHGDRNVVIVEQGYIGYAMDNGIPVLLPQGLHCWTSNSLHYIKAVPLNDHVIRLGPYTILTVDEGYAAVTQNNGKQMVLKGGQTHFLTHKNWKFQKFLSLKIQSDDLQRMTATTADNIELIVSATITWRVTDVLKAAVNSESTMAISGKLEDSSVQVGFNDTLDTSRITQLKDDLTDGKISQEEYSQLLDEAMRGSTESVYSDRSKQTKSNQGKAGKRTKGGGDATLSKLRHDVLRQCLASLATFVGGVNFSNSFGLSKANHATGGSSSSSSEEKNPMQNRGRLLTAVSHANAVTTKYGVEVININIIQATPLDDDLSRALASGAVAAADALQAETMARGLARSVKIEAEASSQQRRIEAEGVANAQIIRAKGDADATYLTATGNLQSAQEIEGSSVAVELEKMKRSSKMLQDGEKMFFSSEPNLLNNIVLKSSNHKSNKTTVKKKGSWGL